MEETGWEPIETAPKDGTWFVICNDQVGERSYEIGRFEPYYWPEYVPAGDGLFRQEKRVLNNGWAGFNNMHRATHWMPLPTPPHPIKDTTK